jgi:hypothetical protein
LGPGYFITLDMQFGPNSFSDFQFGDLYGTAPSPYGAYLPLRLALSAFSQFLPIEFVEKGLLFSIIFLCGALMHFSLPKGIGSSRYFAGLLYMLSPFVFIRFLVGHFTLLLSYAIWPFAIRSFMDFLEKPDDNACLAKTALLTSAAAVSSHGLFILLLAYLVIFVIRILKPVLEALRGKSVLSKILPAKITAAFSIGGLAMDLISVISRTVLLALIVIIMNLFWLVPTYILSSGTYNPAPAAESLAQFGTQGYGMPVDLAVLTMHGFWREGYILTKDVFDLWYVPFILIMAIVIIGLFRILGSDKGLAVFIAAAGAIGFLLALGESGPLAQFFTLLGDRIPLYLIFRDTQKFVGLLCFAYAWAGAYGVDAIVGKIRSIRMLENPKMVSLAGTAILVLMISLPVIYDYGIFGFLGQIGPTRYPDDWYQAAKIIDSDPTSAQIVVFPAHLYYSYPWVNTTDKIIGMPASQFFSKPVLSPTSIETQYVQSDMIDSKESYMAYLFNNRQFINDTARMLLPLDARYILVLKNDPDYIHYVYLFDRKGGVKDMELVYEGRTLYLFRDNLVQGPFFASKENGSGGFDSILKNSGTGAYSPEVAYKKTGPASYSVTSSALDYVIFTPRFSRAFSVDGAGFSPWHQLVGSWRFTGPVTVANWMFPITSGLFILAWLIAFLLFVRFSWGPALIGAAVSIIIYMAVLSGFIGPPLLGTLSVVSLIGALLLPNKITDGWKSISF